MSIRKIPDGPGRTQPAHAGDRRTLKTKRALAEAFRQLLLEKGYDAITIQDIIDRADVGRSTFYAHYEGKEQLLIGNINFQEALIITKPSGEDCPMGINLPWLFNHTKEHIDLYRVLSRSKSLDLVSNYFAGVCVTKLLEYHGYARLKKVREKMLLRYTSVAAAGAIVSMLAAWLTDGAAIPAEEMISKSKNILAMFFPDTR
ncbi:MAG: TetR/AcrR family transcriptional regulator [Chitinophagaceae bacterium]|nr:TetR/AcrR family transcriptional regulator [Chitinophagaceae bacterium]